MKGTAGFSQTSQRKSKKCPKTKVVQVRNNIDWCIFRRHSTIAIAIGFAGGTTGPYISSITTLKFFNCSWGTFPIIS